MVFFKPTSFVSVEVRLCSVVERCLLSVRTLVYALVTLSTNVRPSTNGVCSSRRRGETVSDMSNPHETTRTKNSELTNNADQFNTYRICMQLLQQLVEVRELLGETKEEVERLESLVAENGVGSGLPSKEFFTPNEVAEILGNKPYTVREWCRYGRIHAVKSKTGRGAERAWRISREEIVRYQNEGLLPEVDAYRSHARGNSKRRKQSDNEKKGE